ncbi:protein translocase subunit SecD [Desulfurobacterium atlanticum]|uniref:Protein translocase subunit SecD n=1 Tax=Desulfurobacterium atlanticum TaxID=240169 RepID=A0A238XJU7_9BACT|nr:protein translocase subunit SecD [Desulfurobacterium atlanticum]SNR58990.1 preprotein translocase subunit SecD [Desulfurobacterium atlanticum]
MKSLKWRLLVVLSVFFAALYVSFTKKVNLGLDLQGGTHLVLQVDVEKALENEVSTYMREITSLLREKKIPVLDVKRKGTFITVEILDSDRLSSAVKLIKDEYGKVFDIKVRGTSLLLSLKDSYKLKEEDRLCNQALETIRNRIDQLGVAEPVIVRSGKDRIIVELPGIKNPDRAKKILGKVAKLEFKQVIDVAPTKEELIRKAGGKIPDDEEILVQEIKKNGKVVNKIYYLVKKEPILTGAYLKDAYPGVDQYNMPAVNFEFKSQGAKIFKEYTASHIGTRLAIVLDGKVQSAPVIQSQIGEKGQITGQFTYQEAKDLAIVLRAGALPAPVKIIEETTIGPSLGKESIEKGIKSAVAGLIIVMIFMAIYYRLSGVIADIALLMNVVLLWALLALLGATLTLPGIAGYILTIGMSVDANVIIFERIKEELKKGRSLISAIEIGFSAAWGTILDANITTLVSAAVLFQFGTGPIKGFAITLSLGILCSMFTAVFVTKVLLDLIIRYKRELFSI